MAKLTLILGGARSGKSAFAVELGKRYSRVVYVATAQILDEEMANRVKLHRQMRPEAWRTIESPYQADKTLEGLEGQADLVLIDCLTLYVSNLLLDEKEKEEKGDYILGEIERLCRVSRAIAPDVVMVSNEVGQGIVPVDPLARKFQDISGLVNQRVARAADEVYLVTAGIPTRIK